MPWGIAPFFWICGSMAVVLGVDHLNRKWKSPHVRFVTAFASMPVLLAYFVWLAVMVVHVLRPFYAAIVHH